MEAPTPAPGKAYLAGFSLVPGVQGGPSGNQGLVGGFQGLHPEYLLVRELVTNSGERCIYWVMFRITCLGGQARQILLPMGLFTQRHKTA